MATPFVSGLGAFKTSNLHLLVYITTIESANRKSEPEIACMNTLKFKRIFQFGQ